MQINIAFNFYVFLDQRSSSYDSNPLPRFSEPELQNHTVRVGNMVNFACSVEHLGNYKVTKPITTIFYLKKLIVCRILIVKMFDWNILYILGSLVTYR